MTYMPGRQAFRLPTPITDTLAIETHRKFRPSVTPAVSWAADRSTLLEVSRR